MAPSLGDLPPECLRQILSNIGKSGWLLDVAMTCRSLYDLTIPYLYTNVDMVFHDYPAQEFPYLIPFTIHILDHPRLAALVRNFALRNASWSNSRGPHEIRASKNLDEATKEAVHRFSHSQEEADMWIEDLKHGCDEEAYICLLLPSLPNLERLDLMIPVLPEFEKYFHRMILQRISRRERPFDTQPAFSMLDSMVNNSPALEYSSSVDLLPSFLELLSMRSYYCRKVISDGNESCEALAQLPTASSGITHLELRDTRLNESDLFNLLRICSNIQTLVYEVGFDQWSSVEYSTPATGKGLTSLENTLENLWLDFLPGWSYHGGDDLDELSAIGPFTNFKVLKNLKLGVHIIFGPHEDEDGHELCNQEIDIADGEGNINLANVLPASLETIYFSHTNGRIRLLTKALEGLLEQKESATPNLKRVAFEAFISGNREFFDFTRLDCLAEDFSVRIDRIDGTALRADNFYGWEYTPGTHDRGQGMDGSVTWASEICLDRGSMVPVFVNAGR